MAKLNRHWMILRSSSLLIYVCIHVYVYVYICLCTYNTEMCSDNGAKKIEKDFCLFTVWDVSHNPAFIFMTFISPPKIWHHHWKLMKQQQTLWHFDAGWTHYNNVLLTPPWEASRNWVSVDKIKCCLVSCKLLSLAQIIFSDYCQNVTCCRAITCRML